MKDMKKIILAILIALPLVGCANNNGKSNEATESQEEAVLEAGTESEKGQVVGGFTEYRDITEEELAMFNHVIGKGEDEIIPQKVATQVVNGINYKFFCDSKSGYNLTRCEVIIYKPINGEPTLTKIEVK